MKIQPNYSEASRPMEAGTYFCRVIAAELKHGKEKGTPYVNWQLETVPEKRKVFYSTPIEGRGAGMLKHFIRCIDKNYEEGEYDTDILLGHIVKADLNVESKTNSYDGKTSHFFTVKNISAPTLEQLEKLNEEEELKDLGFQDCFMERKFTEEEIEQGYYTDDSEDIICPACKEHSSVDMELDENGQETGESLGSSCCGS